MKWKKIVIFLLIPFFAQAEQDIERRLSSVTLFSFGFNGFVAKKMPQQIIYEDVLHDKNSVLIFESIMKGSHATPEARAYAACGLWEKKEINKIYLDDSLKELQVTILSADILTKEKLGGLILRIKLYGC